MTSEQALGRTILAVLAVTLVSTSQAAEARNDRLAGLLSYAKTQVAIPDRPGVLFVSYKDNDQASPSFGVELCVLEARRARLRVKDLRLDQSPAMLFAAQVPPTALAVMTGGFFGTDGRGKPIPLGYTKADGQLIANTYPWKSGGFVGASDRGVAILPISRLRDDARYTDVLQSKPLLVEKGNDGIVSARPERFDRSAVAVDARGAIYFFVLHEPVGGAASLAEFSRLLLAFRSSDGHRIVNALAMDGGPGAHLYVPSLKKHCGAGVPTFVPNALYLTP